MQLSLNDEEGRTLWNVLHDYLPAVRRQHAATDLSVHALKDELHKRIVLCERLLGELPRGSSADTDVSRRT